MFVRTEILRNVLRYLVLSSFGHSLPIAIANCVSILGVFMKDVMRKAVFSLSLDRITILQTNKTESNESE